MHFASAICRGKLAVTFLLATIGTTRFIEVRPRVACGGVPLGFDPVASERDGCAVLIDLDAAGGLGKVSCSFDEPSSRVQSRMTAWR